MSLTAIREWVDIRRVREIKSGFRRLPDTATRELPFRSAVVNTDARWAATLGRGGRDPLGPLGESQFPTQDG